jgi:hypothetical protein
MLDSNGELPRCFIYCRDGWKERGDARVFGDEEAGDQAKLLLQEQLQFRGPKLKIIIIPKSGRRCKNRCRPVSPEEAYRNLEQRKLA